ncbi:hypothetical protein SAY87_009329 [Trapa incisa]|uniref:Bulb-type lectin domain-containing protein n=1 Tax=Trapa incisa TaxID=236973 RepID=A0AAN7JYI6_9MYRT|nr:hypothetical protein SAY87_009329 [Trapa incisa]
MHRMAIASPNLTPSFIFSIVFIALTFATTISDAAVPVSRTFKYVNTGDFGEYTVEYEANYRPLNLYTFPFQLCFYNTTPNAFMLALRMGHHRSESIMRWVWEANRGKPVKENATVTFGPDGNLVLADADGSVVWQTATANKGVVGLNLQQNGNIVLYDKKGKPVWQSFDYPTDTLLVGQKLNYTGPTRITSRMSAIDGSEGPYSFGIEQGVPALVMYYKSKNSPTPMLYYRSLEFGDGKGSLAHLTLTAQPESEGATAYDIYLVYDMNGFPSFGAYSMARPKYNATYSMLRVEYDGNLRIHTYDENVDWGAWGNPLTLFDRGEDSVSECSLPKRCGSLGVCEDSQCVACPTPKGMLGWSKSCVPPTLAPCGQSKANGVGYYKVVGVEHFLSVYGTKGDGPVKLVDCRDKCTKDCKCVGFFYREESSKCLLVPELDTLTRVDNTSHVGYIKISK